MLLLLGGVGRSVAALKLLHRSSCGCRAAEVFCNCCRFKLLLLVVTEGLLLLVTGGAGVVLVLLPLPVGFLGLGVGLTAAQPAPGWHCS
jgi:hypothetical protein